MATEPLSIRRLAGHRRYRPLTCAQGGHKPLAFGGRILCRRGCGSEWDQKKGWHRGD